MAGALFEARSSDLTPHRRPDSCATGLQETPSLLLAASPAQVSDLGVRQADLAAAGIASDLLDQHQLWKAEPALRDSTAFAGLLVRTDAQLVSPARALPAARRAEA